MKAMIVNETGPLDNLKLTEVSDPVAVPDSVVIDVKACAVNFADGLMVKGTYQVKPKTPFSPGLEVCGHISAIGSGVMGWKIGDKVQALTNWGGFAEKVACPAANLIAISPEMPASHAAAFIVTYGTAHVGLTYRGRLKKDEWLLVTGAGGGAGLAAVEIGALLGAKVIAAASSSEKLEAAKSKGAQYTVNYKEEDLTEAVKKITGGRGVDLVFDPVGGKIFDKAFRATAPEGRILIIGFASGEFPKIKANHMLVKNIEVIGFYWGFYKTYNNQILKDSADVLFDWYAAGKISPHIGKTYKLEETVEAIAALENRQATGKLVIEI